MAPGNSRPHEQAPAEPPAPALLTDLYELTMAASYFSHGMGGEATFELFARELPEGRNFLVACGTEDAADYLAGFAFQEDEIGYLRSLGMFDEQFLAYLADFRFTGDLWALPEGELFFDDEPVLRVIAPLIEAQMVETLLLNTVGFQSLVASKAARVTIACQGRPFADFSPRRDHGRDAAVKAAYASYAGGAAATSNVLAGQRYGLPLSGTMAHSYVMSFERETEAFECFLASYPRDTTLLIDTYDTIEGARRAVKVMREMGDRVRARAVRIDSGDLAELSRAVRRVLDESGFPGVQIFVSGDLDEYRIAALLEAGAPIDAFGVGTQLGTGGDVPSLGVVYKLVADEQGPKMKRSPGKATVPGAKQIYRFEEGGEIRRDVLALADEPPPGGRPLLRRTVHRGQRVEPREPLATARARALAGIESLPARLRALEAAAEPYAIEQSPALRRVAEQLGLAG
ncbi:MAG: nicotinate phosphoribosyltransferase [Hyphomicrobiales bacterium]